MSKHTPKPWKHTKSDRGRAGTAHFISCTDEDDNGAICQVFGACRAPAELLGNIRLIAAAPELLMWAKDLVDRIEGKFGGPPGVHTDDKDAIRMLKKAIAKAEGKE